MARLGIVLAVFVAAQIRAQDALRSALSLDPALAPRENPVVEVQPNQPHLGPVQFGLGAYLGATYDDNFFESSSNPQSDVILRGGINLSLSWQATDRSELRFSTGLGYLQYVLHSAYSGLEVSPDSALTYALSYGDTTVTLYDQFNYWREVATEGALANIATLPRLDNTIGTRIAWQPSRWEARAGYGHDIFLSDNSANNYLDRSTEDFFGRLSWSLAQKSQAGLEASGSFTSYRVPIQSNNQSFSIGPYADWQLRPTIHLILRGGPTYYFFDANGRSKASTLSSYYLGLSLSHQLTDFFSHSLDVRRDIEPGLNLGSDYIEQLTLSYSLSYALTQRIGLSASVTYQNGSQPLPLFVFGPFIIEGTEHYEFYGAGPQVSWRFTDKLTASLRYFHWQRSSTFAGRGFGENTVSFNLAYTF